LKGQSYYPNGILQEAARLFPECLEYYEGDRAARSYLERCDGHIA